MISQSNHRWCGDVGSQVSIWRACREAGSERVLLGTGFASTANRSAQLGNDSPVKFLKKEYICKTKRCPLWVIAYLLVEPRSVAR